MEQRRLPLPIVYAVSAVIVMLGAAISYQVLRGAFFSYEGSLGTIILGQGEDATTLKEFVEHSQTALVAAETSIANLEEENTDLREQITRYRATINKIRSTAGSAQRESDQQSLSSVNAIIEESGLTRRTSKQNPPLEPQRKILEQQLKETRAVWQMLQDEKQ